MTDTQQQQKHQAKDVLTVEENNGQNYWHKVGVAFVNKDGSLTVKLHMFPHLRLQIRDKREQDSK